MPSPTTARLCSRRTGRRPGRAGEPTAGGASSPEHRDPRPTTERSRTTSPPSSARTRRGVRRSVVVVVPERHRVPRIGDGERVVPDAIRAAGGDDGGCRTPDDPRQRRAADRLVARIDAADDRVLGVVPRTGGPDNRIVRALRRAAERGVDVHLLLSSAWYDRPRENRALVDELADEPIEVAVSPNREADSGRFTKGLVVDDTAVVGSLNWNEGRGDEEQRYCSRSRTDRWRTSTPARTRRTGAVAGSTCRSGCSAD